MSVLKRSLRLYVQRVMTSAGVPHGGDSLGSPRYSNVPPAYEGRNFTYEE